MDDNYGGSDTEDLGEDLEFLEYLEEEEGRKAVELLAKALRKAHAVSVSNKKFREWFIEQVEAL